jgi:HEPN domain-containing protein
VVLTGEELSLAYLTKARLRMEMLRLLADREGWSDLVREAQELVELATKAMLRQVGIDPPRLHDVGPVLLAEMQRFPPPFHDRIPRLAGESQWLRAQRELAFYGDVEWIPTERYGPADGERALAAADLALQLTEELIVKGG